MEFWDEILQRKLILTNTKLLRILLNPCEEVDRPTASDVIRNLDHLDLFVFDGGEEYVVHVHKTNFC